MIINYVVTTMTSKKKAIMARKISAGTYIFLKSCIKLKFFSRGEIFLLLGFSQK